MNIVYWSDYACPFCYIGETHMKQALKNLRMDVDMEMKAFELDPSAGKQVAEPTVERFARKYGLSKEAAQARIDGISQMGRECGLDFRYAETRYTNTFDVHRLTKLALEWAEARWRTGFRSACTAPISRKSGNWRIMTFFVKSPLKKVWEMSGIF